MPSRPPVAKVNRKGCESTDSWEVSASLLTRERAEAIKAHVGIPIIAVGRLGYPELANQVLAENKADFVALGYSSRALGYSLFVLSCS